MKVTVIKKHYQLKKNLNKNQAILKSYHKQYQEI